MSVGRKRWWARGVLVVGPALISGCSGRGAFLEPATEEGSRILQTWDIFGIAALAVATIVLGLIVYAVVRFRAKGDESLPPQTRQNIGWEIVYTATPIVIVIALFVVSFRAIDFVQAPRQPDVVVDVEAYQWGWTFSYPDLGVRVEDGPDLDPTFVIPVDSNIRFVLHSDDVIHSFFVPGFLYKHDVIPGQTFVVDVRTTKRGSYDGHCAEFCGLLHDQMNFQVDVVDRPDFDAWIVANGGSQ